MSFHDKISTIYFIEGAAQLEIRQIRMDIEQASRGQYNSMSNIIQQSTGSRDIIL